MSQLEGRTALVTGASRGVGKGIAVALAKAGATVWITARTYDPNGSSPALPGSLSETKDEIQAAGGNCMAVACDHTKDDQVASVFEQIADQEKPLDLLVNSVWGGYETMYTQTGEYVWERRFWEQPISQWDSMFAAGVRSAWIASHHAARQMAGHKKGLIVNVSQSAGRSYVGNVCYGVSKAATDRLTKDCAQDLRDCGVAVVSYYPGLVRTERVMRAAKYLDLTNSESPEFAGRVIAALFNSPDLMSKSGMVLNSTELGTALGVQDLEAN